MKKFILTDQKTILGVVGKLVNVNFTCVEDNKKYLIIEYAVEKDMNKTISIVIRPDDGIIEKAPIHLMTILKESKVELRVKQLNPFRIDLYQIIEIIIEPLSRSTVRANVSDIIELKGIHYAQIMDLSYLLSLHGKTSNITQALQKYSGMFENALNKYGYFITNVEIGFYYSADSPLLNHLADSKSPYFLRDAYKKQFYAERSFFDASKKLKPQFLNGMIDTLLLENVKSVIIIPFFGSGNSVLLGYVQLKSSLPNLGNNLFNNDADFQKALSQLLSFIELKCEDLTFELELANVKEWKPFSEKEHISDISQDGKGIGIVLSSNKKYPPIERNSKIAFTISINKMDYLFFGSIKNIKNNGQNLGIKIYTCQHPDGLGLLAAYASQVVPQIA